MTKNGTTFKWCEKDCHEKAMWCARKTCRNKAEYAEFMASKRRTNDNSSTTSTNSSGMSRDFKIAMAAMLKPEDKAALESQFEIDLN